MRVVPDQLPAGIGIAQPAVLERPVPILRLDQGTRDQLSPPQIILTSSGEERQENNGLIVNLGTIARSALRAVFHNVALEKARLLVPRQIDRDVIEEDRSGTRVPIAICGYCESTDHR
jgi:hypothetical protein